MTTFFAILAVVIFIAVSVVLKHINNVSRTVYRQQVWDQAYKINYGEESPRKRRRRRR